MRSVVADPTTRVVRGAAVLNGVVRFTKLISARTMAINT
jgi:hypothetical protein